MCIIQDSKDDWWCEAGQIFSVNKNAHLTLSVTISTSLDASLFLEKSPFSHTVDTAGGIRKKVKAVTLSKRSGCRGNVVCLGVYLVHFGRDRVVYRECAMDVRESMFRFRDQWAWIILIQPEFLVPGSGGFRDDSVGKQDNRRERSYRRAINHVLLYK